MTEHLMIAIAFAAALFAQGQKLTLRPTPPYGSAVQIQ
jgi:hypothetical protein